MKIGIARKKQLARPRIWKIEKMWYLEIPVSGDWCRWTVVNSFQHALRKLQKFQRSKMTKQDFLDYRAKQEMARFERMFQQRRRDAVR